MTEYSDEYIRETIYYLEELRSKARGYAVIWLDIAIDAVLGEAEKINAGRDKE